MRIGRAIKTGLWLGLLAVVLLVAPPVVMFGMDLAERWRESEAALSRASEAGVLSAATDEAPLNLVERAVVAAEFHETWPLPGRATGAIRGPGGLGATFETAS